MNGRERVLTALDGGTPDRVPRALGFGRVEIKELAPAGEYRDDLIDVQFVRFGPWPAVEELRRLIKPYPLDTRLGTTEQATTYQRWGYHPETPDQRNPLAHARSLDDLRALTFPDADVPDDVEGLTRQVAELHASGLAAGGNLPHLGGELFEAAWRLRGLESFLLDMIHRPEWAHLLLGRLTEMALVAAEAMARTGADVLALSDDIGMPRSMMMGPHHWREFLKPRMKAIIEAARAVNPDMRVLYHSDGYYEPIIADLVEIGVDAINPLQPEHMDAVGIRRRFGPRPALWGAVGHQTTFPLASPEDIRREVKLRIETLGRAGLVICPAYDIYGAANPWENIAAFINATEEYGW